MVCGELPFDEASQGATIKQILHSVPFYPSFLTPQLQDLLAKLLTKDPDARITIAKIKAHPWFSRTEYVRLLELPLLADEWRVNAVDRDIVARIAALGRDPKEVVHSLLSGEYTELTAMYAMFRREALTDRIRDLMAELASSAMWTVRRDTHDPVRLQPAVKQYSGTAVRTKPVLAKPPRRRLPVLLQMVPRPPPVRPEPNEAAEEPSVVTSPPKPRFLVRPRSISESKA
jgi:hypothetical protein